MSGTAGNVKVLLAGDVNGRLDALFKRVGTVNASNGPFDALLCVGSFFNPEGADDADFLGELAPYVSGEKTAPVPTYFTGGYGLGSSKALAALAVAPECGIRYLGRAGVTAANGLQVAFLDGRYNAVAFQGQKEEKSGEESVGCRYYTSADVDALKAAAAAAEGDVDFLLTNEWPAGVCAGLPEGAAPAGGAPPGASPLADAAAAVRPRYHVVGSQGLFFARAPYLNPDLGAGTLTTRFIALGAVGNTSKQKWLHALGVTPATKMTPEDLSAAPPGATKSPYMRLTGAKRGAADADADDALGEQSWRWEDRAKRQRAPIAAPSLGRADVIKDKSKTAFVRNVPFRATEDDLVSFFSQTGPVVDLVRRTNTEGRLNAFCHVQFESREGMERACQLNGSELMGRQLFIEPAAADERPRGGPTPGVPVPGCWFCLSNADADVNLVASVGEECYVALDKGAITDRHVLVLPVEHYACSLDAPASAAAELERYLSALRSAFAAEGKELVGFERFMRLRKSGGNHCHVNVIAVPAAAAKGAAAAFDAAAARAGFSFDRLPPARGEDAREALREAVQGGEYFVALLPDGSRLVHPIAYGERHPLNFGREVLAELAGVPERADWKECQATPDEEERCTAAFREAFKAFDVMLQGGE